MPPCAVSSKARPSTHLLLRLNTVELFAGRDAELLAQIGRLAQVGVVLPQILNLVLQTLENLSVRSAGRSIRTLTAIA